MCSKQIDVTTLDGQGQVESDLLLYFIYYLALAANDEGRSACFACAD